jgi:hypothetical protein
MQLMILVCASALSLFVTGAALAFDAAAPDTSTGTSDASTAEMKPNKAAPASERDLGARSAKSIECSQKADAKDLHGKPRKHFIHDCKRAI